MHELKLSVKNLVLNCLVGLCNFEFEARVTWKRPGTKRPRNETFKICVLATKSSVTTTMHTYIESKNYTTLPPYSLLGVGEVNFSS